MATTEQFRPGYHDIVRPEILDLIPTTAKNILDLGCGTGALGKALKQRQACRVDGIELNTGAAEIAKTNLDNVFVDNLNRFDPAFLKQEYDCIILADILEHLISPWAVIKKFAAVLSQNGCIIASIPNIAHPWIISQLQKGLFRYELAGLLDITHLRFFTKTTIFQLFCRAKLKILNIRAFPSDENPVQYLVSAVKPLLIHKNPLATILILTLNCWRYTLTCLNSIKAKTHAPHEIIVIDNGSTDETITELRKDITIYHIENSYNLGFARGFNVGLDLIDTPFFALCNNDIVVSSYWLTTLLKNLTSDKELVAVGPVSNYVSGPQLIQNINYDTPKSFEDFSQYRRRAIAKPLYYFPRLVFFCTLFRSDVIQKVGFLDERFEIGNFEDDDYCRRIAIAKLKTAIDTSVFIHHYGSQTFRENEINYNKIMEENKEKFFKKWSLTQKPKETPFNNT